MNILLTGSTGMVGGLALKQCLASDKVDLVISVSRCSSGQGHSKLREIIKQDFGRWDELDELPKIDAVIFCLGVYTGEVDKVTFKKITVDYPVSLGEKLYQLNPEATFVLLSGQGADLKEKSPFSFARFKGMAENRLMGMGFKQFNSLRPAYIYPVTEREEPNLSYKFTRKIYPIIKRLGRNNSITSEQLAEGMFVAATSKVDLEVLENSDILDLIEQ